MNLIEAKSVLHRTHIAALGANTRANGIHMSSPPGVGKSDMAEEYAGDLSVTIGEPVGMVIFMLATVTSADVRGFMMPVKPLNGGSLLDTVFSRPPWFPTAGTMRVFEPDRQGGYTLHEEGTWTGPVPRVGVLFLDEFSQADDDVKKPAAELVYKGAVGTAKLDKGWRVLSAGNRMKDRSGVGRELMFIVNRRGLINVEASLPAWRAWAARQPVSKRPHYLTVSFAEKNPDVVFSDAVPEGSDPFCTPRSLCMLDTDLRALRTPDDIARDGMPLDDVTREMAAGYVGQGAAAQYYTHLKYADELPSIDDIVRDPRSARLPPKRDAQMVAAFMLAHNIHEDIVNPVMLYVERLGIEMQGLMVRTMLSNPTTARIITSSPACNRWLARNKDILLASRS